VLWHAFTGKSLRVAAFSRLRVRFETIRAFSCPGEMACDAPNVGNEDLKVVPINAMRPCAPPPGLPAPYFPCCLLCCYQQAESTSAVIVRLFFALLAVRCMAQKVT